MTKYVFSQDHKMISKQYLVTAIIMAWVAVIMSLLATWWNYQFNLWFDRYYLIPRGRWQKTLGERVWHALAFEAGLLILFLPLTAWLLAISLWQALLLDLAFMLFYLVYGYLYHWGYDRVFPLSAALPQDAPSGTWARRAPRSPWAVAENAGD